VYKALNILDNNYYAIKIISLQFDIFKIKNEIDILKSCDSSFITKYIDTYIDD